MTLKHLIIIQVILLTYQIIMYFGCEKFQHNLHNVWQKADDKIPFLPFTAITYSMWFPLIALFPLVLYFAEPTTYFIYMSAAFFEDTLSVICYLIYPTTFKRPTPPDTFFGRLMKLIYTGSYKGVNCAPSLHCSSCFLILYLSCTCSALNTGIRLICGLVAICIVISTMTTKQHTIIDVVSAIGMFILCIILGTIFPFTFLSSFI